MATTFRLQEGINLLGFHPVRTLITWRWFPAAFQLIALVAFVWLAALGWERFAPDGVPSKLYAKSNLVSLVIWGLWWPAMIWGAVLFGRAWCAVCPLELVSHQSERMGQRLGIRQLPLSKALRAGWLIIFLYGIVQLLVAGVGLHRTPAYTSWFLVAMLLMAVIAGFFFKNRAYCRGFCPVGLLLGTYGRGSMLAVRADHGFPGVGETATGSRLNSVARACPSLLNPPKLTSSKDCLICGECIKASEQGEMRFLLRRPFNDSMPIPTKLTSESGEGVQPWERSDAGEQHGHSSGQDPSRGNSD